MLFSIDGSDVLAYGPTEYEPTFAELTEAEATDSGGLFENAWFAASLADGGEVWDGSERGSSDPWLAAGLAGEDGHPEHMLLGSDAQPGLAQRYVPAMEWPWPAIVKLTVTFPNVEQPFVGTGVMVGRNDVLTAAHVVYNPNWGYANSVVVTPASLAVPGYESPYGSYPALVQIADVQFDPDKDGNIRSGSNGPGLVGSERDIALLALRTPLGDRTGWMPIDTSFKEGWAHVSGYPVAYGSRLTDDVAWTHDAVLDSYTDLKHFEIRGGNSGGPVWHLDRSGRPAVVAIVSTSIAAVDLAPYYATPGQMLRQWIPANDHLIA